MITKPASLAQIIHQAVLSAFPPISLRRFSISNSFYSFRKTPIIGLEIVRNKNQLFR
jgi:hypothetical protein